MINFIKDYTAFMIILLLVASVVVLQKRQSRQYQQRITRLQEQIQEDTPLQIVGVDSSTYRKVAVKSEQIQAESRHLKQALRESNGTIRTLMKTKAYLKYRLDSLAIIDTTIHDQRYRQFTHKTNRWYIQGQFQTFHPYRISFNNIRYLLDITVAITENQPGIWSAYIRSEDPVLRVTDIATQVVPYSPSIWGRLHISALVGVGQVNQTWRLSGGLGIGLDRHTLYYVVDTYGKGSCSLLYSYKL